MESYLRIKKEPTMEKLFKVIMEDFKKEFDITKPLTARELKLIEVCYQRMVVKKNFMHDGGGILCGSFSPDNKTSSSTKCKCGREKWEHLKAK